MKNFILFSTFFIFPYFLISQALLPTSCDFTGLELPPVGWSANSPQYYASSGNPAPSFKFDNTNKYLQIHVANEPLLLKFDLISNGVSNPNSVFSVEESPDNVNFTAARVFDSTTLIYVTSYTTFTVSLLPSTRYIKFNYTHKATPGGGNIGLDNVLITKANVSYQQMAIEISGNEITQNSSHYVGADIGDNSVLPFKIKNLGSSGDLIINSIDFTGPDASVFSLANSISFPLTISGQSNSDIGILFSPLVSGLHDVTVTINSNDTDFPTFNFDLNGYGGNYEEEPTSQPTNLSFSDIKTYRFKSSFTASDADGYLILQKKGSPVTTFPQDGQTYQTGDVIGDAKVVSMSPSTSFIPREVVADAEYHFAIYAYNGSEQFTNFLTDNPLTGSIITPETMLSNNYYNMINVQSTDFVEDLYNRTAPHVQHSYATYKDKLIDKFYERDTIEGKKVLTCLYTGELHMYNPPFSHSLVDITREHTYAYSWFPLTDKNKNYYTDYHNLFPIHQNRANVIRSNYPFGIVVSDTQLVFKDAILGKNDVGEVVYEPRDQHKGDVARALFYMALRYTEDGVNWGLPTQISESIEYGQDQNLLKMWNELDPPDGEEIARNDYLDSLQQNRNPFIDKPEYACYINFHTMKKIPEGCNLNVQENELNTGFIIYPNPANIYILIQTEEKPFNYYRITNSLGQDLHSQRINSTTKYNIDISQFEKGIYFLTIATDKGLRTKKFMIK